MNIREEAEATLQRVEEKDAKLKREREIEELWAEADRLCSLLKNQMGAIRPDGGYVGREDLMLTEAPSSWIYTQDGLEFLIADWRLVARWRCACDRDYVQVRVSLSDINANLAALGLSLREDRCGTCYEEQATKERGVQQGPVPAKSPDQELADALRKYIRTVVWRMPGLTCDP